MSSRADKGFNIPAFCNKRQRRCVKCFDVKMASTIWQQRIFSIHDRLASKNCKRVFLLYDYACLMLCTCNSLTPGARKPILLLLLPLRNYFYRYRQKGAVSDYNLMNSQLTTIACCRTRNWMKGIKTTCYQRKASIPHFLIIARTPVSRSDNPT